MSLFSLIQGEMVEVDRRLKQTLADENSLVRQVSDYLEQASGKRLRPALVLLAGQFGPQQSLENLVSVAAAVEMIHMATLVHDDVIDDADVRRGLPAVRTRFSNPVAVLTGDFLFARAFQLFAMTGRPDILSLAAEVVYVMCTGEIAQHLDQGRVATEIGYWRRIEAKTGYFLEASCRLGAMAANASDTVVEVLGQYGHHIGLAYQVVDDVLDWVADPEKLGKAVGEDIQAGIYTLPIIAALADPTFGPTLAQLLAEDHPSVEAVRNVLVESGALNQARERAREHIEKALQVLQTLPPGNARSALQDVAEFIMARDH